MKRFSQRAAALALVLVLIVSVFTGTVSAKTGTLKTNTGVRHQVCTELSAQAKAYYTGSYTYEAMSALEPGTEDCLDQSSEMFQTLSTLMSSTMTNSVSYSSLTSYWPKTDASGGSSNAFLFYSDELSTSYNREHVWPKSRASFHKSGGGSDLHHLRPTNTTINSTRSNYTMGNVRGVLSNYSTKSYNGRDVLYYSSTADLVEVNDEIKGDVARIFLYVWCRWQEPNLFKQNPNPVLGAGDEKNDGKKVIESLDTLLQWCEEDPVDDWEMGRNDQVENVQGNRNVFIDYPEFAWLVFGLEVPDDMQTPSGEAKKQESYQITVASSNASWGTVTLSGKTAIATPAAGYQVKDYTLSPADAATVTRKANTFVLSGIKADCTLMVNFEPRQSATITYSVPSGVSCKATGAYVGDTILLPTPAGSPSSVPDETEKIAFFGWSTVQVPETTAKPAVLAAGSSYAVKEDATLYAVYYYRMNGETGWHYASSLSFCQHTDTRTEREEPTCTGAGYERTICNSCGMTLSQRTLEKLSHDYQATVIAPTCTTGGYTLNTCSQCGDSYRNAFTASTGHSFVGGQCTACHISDPDWDADFENPFIDVKETDWFYPYVMEMAKEGTINGYSDHTFRPNVNLTRAEMVTLLYRVSGSPAVSSKTTFTDVPANAWYGDAVSWAEQQGIVNGVGKGEFEPDEDVSREQLVTMLWRLAGKPESNEDLTAYRFEDVDKVNDWAQTAMQWAVANRIINGTTFSGKPGTYLAPQDSTTRAEAAKILCVY